jgi:hypothetical protein
MSSTSRSCDMPSPHVPNEANFAIATKEVLTSSPSLVCGALDDGLRNVQMFLEGVEGFHHAACVRHDSAEVQQRVGGMFLASYGSFIKQTLGR